MEKKTTGQLLGEALEVLLAIDGANGELTEESIAKMEEFLSSSEDKLGGIKAVLSRFKSEIVLHKQYRDHHVGRVRSMTKAIEYLTTCGTGLLKAMEDLGEEPKVKAEWGSVSLQTSYRTEVDDDLSNVAVRFLIEQPPKVDKSAAKKAIQAGESVAGITLTENRKAVWR